MPATDSRRERLADALLERRGPILGLVLLLTLAAVWSLSGARISVSPYETIVADTDEYEAYRRLIEDYGGSSDDLVYVATREGADLFSAAKLNAIREATRELAELENVALVESLSETLRGAGDSGVRSNTLGGVSRQPYWPEFSEDQERVDLASMRSEMLSDPDVAGIYVSSDGTVQSMVLVVEDALELGPRALIRLREEIRQVLEGHGLGALAIHVAGLPAVTAWIFEALFVCVFVLFPISILVVGGLVYVLFRRVRIALLTIGIAMVALVWAFGVTQWVFGSLNILVAAVPGIVMTISSADVVHLVWSFRRNLAAGQGQRQAVRAAVGEVGGACILTSVTTFIGFISLLVIPALAIRQLAVAASVGVAAALILVVTVVPIVLSRMPPKETPRSAAPRIEAALAFAADASWRIGAKSPAIVVLISVGLLLGGGLIASRLTFEPDLPRRFAPGHPVRASAQFFTEELGGASSFDLLITGEPDAFVSPEVLSALALARDEIEAQPGVLATYSVLDVFEEAARLGGIDTSAIPRSSGAAASRLWTVERLGGRDLEPILSAERDRTRMIVRLRDSRLREGRRITERINGIMSAALPAPMRTEPAGFVPLVGRFLDDTVTGQLQGLGLCYIAVTLILSLAARSFRVGVLTSLPNLLPLVLLGALLKVTLDPTDSDLIMIGTVTLCLAVDNAIHMVHRYRVELSRTTDREVALERTLHSTGGAIIFTTFALCLGFGAFALSSYLTSWIFGSYLLFGLVVGMVANLLVLPALIRLGWLRPPPLVD